MTKYFWQDGIRLYRWKSGRISVAGVQDVSDQTRREEGGSVAEKTIHNPYYIGSKELLARSEQYPPSMNVSHSGREVKPRYAKHTLQEALDEAERRLAKDPSLQAVSVVKIVRVVRRAKPVVAIDIEVVE